MISSKANGMGRNFNPNFCFYFCFWGKQLSNWGRVEMCMIDLGFVKFIRSNNLEHEISCCWVDKTTTFVSVDLGTPHSKGEKQHKHGLLVVIGSVC